jgi:hypothetical protein
MNNEPGEWAVAFHGVTKPKAIYKNGKRVLNSIM